MFIGVSAIALVTAQPGRGEGAYSFAVDVGLIAMTCLGTSRSRVTTRDGHRPAAGKALER